MPLSQVFSHYPALWPGIIFVLGLLVGSFLNVVIHRLPRMLERSWRAECQTLLENDQLENDQLENDLSKQEPGTEPAPTAPHSSTSSPASTFNLATPGSHCPHCQAPIRAWQNIPVLSFLLLRGRCHHCRAPIGARYPLVELAAALLALVVAVRFGWGPQAWAAILFSWALLSLTVIDLDHQLLPDTITLPLLWLGLVLNSTGLFVPLTDAVWGAVAGYLVLWSVYWLFKLVTGKEGMGYGDFKLLAALGAWMGWQQLALIIVLSSVVGAVIGSVALAVQGRDRATPIPFGPYLAAAGWIALLWGPTLVNSYLQFAGIGSPSAAGTP